MLVLFSTKQIQLWKDNFKRNKMHYSIHITAIMFLILPSSGIWSTGRKEIGIQAYLLDYYLYNNRKLLDEISSYSEFGTFSQNHVSDMQPGFVALCMYNFSLYCLLYFKAIWGTTLLRVEMVETRFYVWKKKRIWTCFYQEVLIHLFFILTISSISSRWF